MRKIKNTHAEAKKKLYVITHHAHFEKKKRRKVYKSKLNKCQTKERNNETKQKYMKNCVCQNKNWKIIESERRKFNNISNDVIIDNSDDSKEQSKGKKGERKWHNICAWFTQHVYVFLVLFECDQHSSSSSKNNNNKNSGVISSVSRPTQSINRYQIHESNSKSNQMQSKESQKLGLNN